MKSLLYGQGIPKTMLFRLLFMVFTLCGKIAYTQNSISGELKDLPPGNLQLIREEDLNRRISRLIAEIPVDSAGRFHYQGNLSPHIYTLRLNDSSSIMLAIDKDQQIEIKGNASGIDSLDITGSDDTKLLQEYESYRKASLDSLVISVRKSIRQLKQRGTPETDTSLIRLAELEVTNYEIHRDELMNYIATHMGTSLAVYATSIRWGGEKHNPFLAGLAKDFEAAHPGTAIAEKVEEKVRIIQSNSVGGNVADIRMPDKDGVFRSLSSIKSRYTLIDFWASWCVPCRRESPVLANLYQRFNAAGFEIYGVSFDSSREPWIKAIEHDKRDWINVSTLEGFETPASFDFAVTSLPANVLIDKSGKVIARDLHGNELKKLIEQLFPE